MPSLKSILLAAATATLVAGTPVETLDKREAPVVVQQQYSGPKCGGSEEATPYSTPGDYKYTQTFNANAHSVKIVTPASKGNWQGFTTYSTKNGCGGTNVGIFDIGCNNLDTGFSARPACMQFLAAF